MKVILRDVIILLTLTMLGGFIIGIGLIMLGLEKQDGYISAVISNILLSVVGFCISGSMTSNYRSVHLFKVAIAYWLACSINIVLLSASLYEWASSLIVILIAMEVGRWGSYYFSPKSNDL